VSIILVTLSETLVFPQVPRRWENDAMAGCRPIPSASSAATVRRAASRRAAYGCAILLAVGLAGCTSDGGDAVAGPSSAGMTAASGSAGAPTRTAASCSPARPAPAGGSSRPATFRYGGTDRIYLLTLPADDEGRSARPLVFDFHGFASSAAKHAADTGLGPAGAARGVIVVTPQALGSPRQWNAFGRAGKADDVGFIHALVADLERRLCVDRARVYATGHSNGAAFAGFLVCTAPFEFAAVAMVSGTTPAACPAGVAPATMAVAGTADPQVPYAGGTVGRSTTRVPAATTTMQAYARHYACAGAGRQDTPWPGVRRLRYGGCVDGAEVVLDTVVGGQHVWPGGDDAAASMGNSRAGVTFSATKEVLDFFARHRRTA
jgi:polyhydroxybutyrate depolymerase